MKKLQLQSGLTMIETLVVVAVIGILVVMALRNLPNQIEKGRDGKRKSDLQKIKVAFENYYSDKDCYPPPEILDNCNSQDLAPYLASIPCDPRTKTKYLYAPEANSCPKYYRIFARLEVKTDPVIQDLGCHTMSGCGAYTYFPALGLEALEYDYGVSEGVPVFVTNADLPPGSSGFCCQVQKEQCNVWNEGDGVCNIAGPFSTLEECDLYCGYPP